VGDELFSNDLRTVARKLQGKRASKKIADDPSTPDVDESKQSISASQMSFDSRIANFEELINLLVSSGKYKPNESDLKISALEAMLVEMKAKNIAAVIAVNKSPRRPHQSRQRALQRHRRHHRANKPRQKIHQIPLRREQSAIQTTNGSKIQKAVMREII
jgi:hypothetical protein